jgi:hypothetical protein
MALTWRALQPNLNREANLDNTSGCVDLDQTNLIDNVSTICHASENRASCLLHPGPGQRTKVPRRSLQLRWIGIRRVALRLYVIYPSPFPSLLVA